LFKILFKTSNSSNFKLLTTLKHKKKLQLKQTNLFILPNNSRETRPLTKAKSPTNLTLT